MKATNAANFLKMLNPSDLLYGFKKLSNGDVDKLIKYYQGKKHLLRGLKRDEAKGILWEKVYKGDKNDLYGEDLLASGVLEVPATLRGLSVKGLREKLTKHKLYSYKFKVSYESTYKHAIRVLQQSLNVSVTGRYTVDVAKALYQKIKADVPKKKGYLASEDDPDRLFQNGFEEYVFCVDQNIWTLCGVEEKWLKDDNHGIWTKTEALPIDLDCLEALHSIEMNGVGYTESLYSKSTKMGQIFTLGKRKAREILDELMTEGVYSAFGDKAYHIIAKYSYGQKFEDKLEEKIDSAQDEQALREAIPQIADFILSIAMVYLAQKSNFQVLSQANSQAPIVNMQALSEITSEWLAQNSQPGGSLGDVLALYIDDVDLSDIEKLQVVKTFVQSSEYNYLIAHSIFNLREKFVDCIKEELASNQNKNKYIYSSSKMETELYNTVIVHYLQEVLHINENSEIYKQFFDPFLE